MPNPHEAWQIADTGRVLSYGDVPARTYPDYVGPTPKITWSDSVPLTAE